MKQRGRDVVREGGSLPAGPLKPTSTLFNFFMRNFFKHNIKDSMKRRKKRAIALWYKLSAEDKEKLYVKYEESKTAYAQEYADYLATMQPYLVEKLLPKPNVRDRNSEDQENNTDFIKLNQGFEADASLGDYKRPASLEYVHCARTGSPDPVEKPLPPPQCEKPLPPPQCEKPLPPPQCEKPLPPPQCEKPLPPPQCEKPLPPPHHAKELFILTRQHVADRQQCLVEWATLSGTQKRRYREAVKIIKQEYLDNYKKYLSSLSSYELYKYWKENT